VGRRVGGGKELTFSLLLPFSHEHTTRKGGVGVRWGEEGLGEPVHFLQHICRLIAHTVPLARSRSLTLLLALLLSFYRPSSPPPVTSHTHTLFVTISRCIFTAIYVVGCFSCPPFRFFLAWPSEHVSRKRKSGRGRGRPRKRGGSEGRGRAAGRGWAWRWRDLK